MNENTTINPNATEIASLEAQIAGININNLDPNDNGKIISPVVETKQQPVQETKAEVTTETEVQTTEDPIKTELERVKGQTQGKTQKEKFEYKLQRELAQAKEMGIDIAGLAGIKAQPEETYETEDKPLTRKDLESILQKANNTTKSATEMALGIENEAERELHLHYLENKINPNLSEEEKFQTAKDMVNAIKLKNQISLGNVRPQTTSHSTAQSFQPVSTVQNDNARLTMEEEMLYRDSIARGIPFSKEEIIASRAK